MSTLISSYVKQGDLGEPFSETIIPPPGRKIWRIEMRIGTGSFTNVPFSNPYSHTINIAALNNPVLVRVCTVPAPASDEFIVEIVMGNGGSVLHANPGDNTIRLGADFRPRFVPFSGKEIAHIVVSNPDGSSPVPENIVNRQGHTVILDNMTGPKKIYVTFRNL